MHTNQKRKIIVNSYAYPFISQELVAQSAPSLTFFSLFSYGISPDGHLIDLDDTQVRDYLKDYPQVAPLMVVTAMTDDGNFDSDRASELFRSEEMQSIWLADILNTLRAKNLKGVDFDFEFVYPESKDDYSRLIQVTREFLNPFGYIVTAAVAPKTSSDQPGLLYQGHDYAAIGKAANLVLVMTYEWGYTYGPPMAVAPVNKVREVLDYAVTQIPRDKLLMGIPNYGYDWTLPFVQGESRARSISNVEAPELAKRYGAAIQFDELAQSPHFNYTAEDGREHEVWFEDARSIEAKLNLVSEYNLAGVSYWNLMNPFPANWELLNQLYDIAQFNPYLL